MLSQKLIELHFSEPVNVALTGTMDLYDCGDDFVCDASDPQVAQYIMNETNGTSIYNTTAVTVDGRSAMVDLELGVKFDLFDYRRYKLVVSAGAFYDDEENDLPEETLEFLKQPVGAGGFSRSNVLPPTASTDAGISFAAQLSADTTPGLYTLCYCDANLDTTLQDTGDKGTTYLSKPGQMTAATITGWANAALADDICETKCKAGCVGTTASAAGTIPRTPRCCSSRSIARARRSAARRATRSRSARPSARRRTSASCPWPVPTWPPTTRWAPGPPSRSRPAPRARTRTTSRPWSGRSP
jgi:hypothetical protein